MPQFYQDEQGIWQRVPVPVPLKQVIRSALLNALAYTDGHQEAAARLLQISEHQLRYAMQKHGIPTGRQV